MTNFLLPHGSRRRARVKSYISRFRNKRRREFHEREYNNYRQEYYRTANRLFIDNGPLISVIVPCWNPEYLHIQALVDSVIAQGYENWELVLADASSDEDISGFIDNLAKSDTRIVYHKLKNNSGIGMNTNAAIEIAKGEYIAFLDHDDTLDPDALAYNALAIEEYDPDLLYSDEDKVTDDGTKYFEPHFKPDFSLSMLRNVNYITHFVVVRRSIAEKVGLIESGFDGAQDYNFLLNIVDVTDKIYHIPRILYHWRQAATSTASDFSSKAHIKDAGVKALNNHLKRRGIKGKAKAIENRPGFYEITYDLTKKKRAIVIDLLHCTNKEINFIKKFYDRHHDVKDYEIDVVVSKLDDISKGDYDEIIYVSEPIIPTRDEDRSINRLFGVIGAGVKFSAPKKASRDKLMDCGLVQYNGGLVPLFHGTDATSPQYFGSHEWNREVNGLSWGAVCGKTADIKSLDRTKLIISDNQVVIGQTEYLAFDEAGHRALPNASKKNYFNPNLETEMYPRLIKEEPLRERVEIGK